MWQVLSTLTKVNLDCQLSCQWSVVFYDHSGFLHKKKEKKVLKMALNTHQSINLNSLPVFNQEILFEEKYLKSLGKPNFLQNNVFLC